MRTKSQVVLLAIVVILLSVLLLPPLPGQSPNTGTLTVRVVGAHNASGEIRVALFQSAEASPAMHPRRFALNRLRLILKH